MGNGSTYGDIPFADEIKDLITTLETTMDTLITSLETTVTGLETAISSLESDLEEYNFAGILMKWNYIISDDLLKSDDAEVTHDTDVQTKKKEITFNPEPSRSLNTGLLRILWKVKVSETGGYFQIRINGDMVYDHGYFTETTWQQKNYDLITPISHNDKIQLYLRKQGSGVIYAKDFRIYGKTEGIEYTEPIWE